MNQAETLIRTMCGEGLSAFRIADALYDRGMKNGLGRTYTVAMIEGFIRYAGLEDEHLASIVRNRPAVIAEVAEEPIVKLCPHRRDVEPIAEPTPKVRMLRPWPLHTDFSPDNLMVRD